MALSHGEADGRPEKIPDLPTQLESLLHQVWICEAEWRFEERLRRQIAAAAARRLPR